MLALAHHLIGEAGAVGVSREADRRPETHAATVAPTPRACAAFGLPPQRRRVDVATAMRPLGRASRHSEPAGARVLESQPTEGAAIMGTPSATGALRIARVDHEEAMQIAATENDRVGELVRALGPGDWDVDTDCTDWTVRDVVVHLIAAAEAQASPVEFARQVRAGRPLTRQIGGQHWVDGLNESQLRARRAWTPEELPRRWTTAAAAALRARRRMPALLRALPVLPLGSGLGTHLGWKPVGYLFDMGFTRDAWMHRVDLARAVGRPLVLTPEHDGRIVADIVAEWAIRHGEPCTLDLSGPAGGRYVAGTGGEHVAMDAIESCRILSGRGYGEGVLRHKLPL